MTTPLLSPGPLLSPTPPTPASPPAGGSPPGRRFDDLDSIRSSIYDSVFDQVNKFEPVANASHTLSLTNPRWVDPPGVSLKERKKAILRNESLGRRLRADWTLTDNATGQPVANRSSVVATVPKLTDGGTFVNRGVEYTVANQLRLLPGIFTRQRASGEIESHVNVLPGQGVSHRYTLDPAKSLFKIEVAQSSIPLLPLLRAMGATDTQMREAWGDQLLSANTLKDDARAIPKLHERLLSTADRAAHPDPATAVAAAVSKMRLDQEVTARTLGRPHANLSVDAILDSTKKLLAVYRGEAEPDSRDAMVYQKLMGPDDLLAERIRAGRSTARRLLWKATAKRSLAGVPTGFFDPHIKSLFQGSGLANAAEEVNPLEMMGQWSRVTRLGEGGIGGGTDAVPDECYDEKTEVFTRHGWVSWASVSETTEFACLINDQMEFHHPFRLFKSYYDGPMFGIKTRTLDHLVTPGHRVWCRRYRSTSSVNRLGVADWRFELASDVHNRPREFAVACRPYVGRTVDLFTLPEIAGARRQYAFDINDWAEFVGWFVAEGSIDRYSVETRKNYTITISQSSTANPQKVSRIQSLLQRMQIPASYQGHSFVLHSKQIGAWLTENVGLGSHQKRLPRECFDWPVAARQRLLESLVLGDGNRSPNGASCYGSVNKLLVEDVCRLATGLGMASRLRRPDDRRRDAGVDSAGRRVVVKRHDYHVCGLLLSRTQGVTSERMYSRAYYVQDYRGVIYCAEVPGGLLLVRRNRSVGMWSGNSRTVHASQLGFIDPILTPESSRAGVDLRLAGEARKGPNGQMLTRVRNVKTGQTEWKSARELADHPLVFPGEMKGDSPTVSVVRDGHIRQVPRDQVTYEIPHMEGAFNPLANLIAGKSAVKGQRAVMASRMYTQALALDQPEAPLVQSGVPDSDESYEERYGVHVGAVRAKAGGRVTAVQDGMIRVRDATGKEHEVELAVNLPYNRKSLLHHSPTVTPGQEVKPGDLLARSNYTDDQGRIALGKNLYTAYLPDGNNFEDAITVSASAARKLKSEHLYQHSVEHEEDVKRSKRSFVALFPSQYDRRHLSSLDDDGVIRPGTVVEHGQPLVLGARLKPRTHNRVLRGGADAYGNDTYEWEHHSPGVVTDVEKTDNGVVVAVKSYHEAKEGDKLSGRLGDKGLLKVVPDDHMPHDAQGKPFELLLNPLGIQTRGNPQQVYETVLGKIAKLTGKPYKLKDFSDISDLREYAEKEAQAHGVSDTETVTDPQTGTKIPGVLTGYRFMMKLHHLAEDKNQGRGLGSYSSDDQPARGSGPGGGSKRFSIWDTWAMLSHGALHGIKDAKSIRGQKNDDYWAMFQAGHRPPDPDVPLVYKKFISNLQAAGINPVRSGTRTRLLGMTDKDVQQLTEGREVRSADTVHWGDQLKPVAGGLFDPVITGGHSGSKWAGLRLHEPMPNPVFEEPIRRLLGLTKDGFRDVLAGRKEIAGKSGPAAVADALGAIDVKGEAKKAEAMFRSGKKTYRDDAVKKWAVLRAADKFGVHPKDWMLSTVPVLPPAFRPVSMMQGSNRPMVADPNWLYKELHDANQNLKELSPHTSEVGDERLAVYDAFKGVVGLGDPTDPKNKERGVRGILKTVFGCYDDATEILTRRGWQPIATLQPGIEVFTLNPRTGVGEWQLPTEVQHYDYEGQMIRIVSGRNVDLLLTPDHRNWVKNRTKQQGGADDMSAGWKFEYAYQTAAFTGRQWFRTAADGWDGGTATRPNFLPADADMGAFAEFVGWWLAEGFLGTGGHRNRVSICQSEKSTHYCRVIENVLVRLGLKFTIAHIRKENHSRMRVWNITHAGLAAWMAANCGRGSAGKFISREVLDWPVSLLKKLWVSYLMGDGAYSLRSTEAGGVTHKNNRRDVPFSRFSTVSRQLCDDLSEVGTKLGYTIRVVRSGKNGSFGKRPIWRGNISGSRFTVVEGGNGKGLEWYSGQVHCCTVPNGIVYVRRNGKPVFSGNSSPKFGTMNRKLLSTTVNTVGRSVIVPNADLDMDHVGLPESKAWDVFKPFVVRRLARQGVSPFRAAELISAKDPVAYRALKAEMDERPVQITRAPILHRYGTMAFRPTLVKGDALHLPPLVYKGFGADNDGDQVNYHVPVSPDAVSEALDKLLPSKNLLNVRRFAVHQLPQNEFLAGLYEATHRESDRPAVTFDTKESVIRALRAGKISPDQRVQILKG